ncbi:peptidase M29 [Rhodobacteraceae bacterium (ex Bugula neritina AB1)]|nr:peptidase M29 [Rhodobacteraceae bacterium (ex Bugula neritina AB1)]
MTLPHGIDPDQLDKLAEITVRTGLNLQSGQELVVFAPAEALPLIRRVAVHAYKAGANAVVPFFTDDEMTLARFLHAPSESFDHASEWYYEGIAKALENGAARLSILGNDPMLLAHQDPDCAARLSKAVSRAAKPATKPIANFDVNWCVTAFPGAAWASQVFPSEAPEKAQKMLMDMIFNASRLEGPDPVANWDAHSRNLKTRIDWLNTCRFSELRYRGPGTDLTIGLPDGHVWKGGRSLAGNGVAFQPNIPTEEVFTCPHADRVSGLVSGTKPLSYQGQLIDGIKVRFEAGKAVSAHAAKGQDALRELLETDEGACRIGEVALVPDSSPISRSGVLFYNTLFDENASCHLAFGQSYSSTIEAGSGLPLSTLRERGCNQSMIHVDWMIGSAQLDIDGVSKTGEIVHVMRKGEWAVSLD